jgi:hypothetical protein
VNIVEFQPSGWSRGTYLNVAVMWLWDAKDYFSFDYGPGRVQAFASAGSAQWPERCRAVVTLAADHVRGLRADLPDIAAAAKLLSKNPAPGWPTFHAAVATGLAGDVDRARALATQVLAEDATYDWETSKQAKAAEFGASLGDAPIYRARIVREIQQARALLKLSQRSAAEIASALRAPGDIPAR